MQLTKLNNKFILTLLTSSAVFFTNLSLAQNEHDFTHGDYDTSIMYEGQIYSEEHEKLRELNDLKTKYEESILDLRREMMNLSGEERVRAMSHLDSLKKRLKACEDSIKNFEKKIIEKYGEEALPSNQE